MLKVNNSNPFQRMIDRRKDQGSHQDQGTMQQQSGSLEVSPTSIPVSTALEPTRSLSPLQAGAIALQKKIQESIPGALEKKNVPVAVVKMLSPLLEKFSAEEDIIKAGPEKVHQIGLGLAAELIRLLNEDKAMGIGNGNSEGSTDSTREQNVSGGDIRIGKDDSSGDSRESTPANEPEDASPVH